MEKENNNDLKVRVAVLESLLASNKENLSRQALEYERRLEILNHEAEQLKSMQSTYLPRETWESAQKYTSEEFKKFNKFMDTTKGMATQRSVNTAMLFSILGVLTGVFGVIIAIIK